MRNSIATLQNLMENRAPGTFASGWFPDSYALSFVGFGRRESTGFQTAIDPAATVRANKRQSTMEKIWSMTARSVSRIWQSIFN